MAATSNALQVPGTPVQYARPVSQPPTPIFGGPANLPQAPAIGYSSAYGGIPQVPNPLQTQSDVIQGDIGSLGGLYNLADPLNRFNQQQAALGLQANLPGYQGMIGQSSANIGSMLRGQIPQDVQNLLGQSAAERGVATGGIGSPNANTALLRSLGLTSLGLQQQGEQELTTAIGRTPQAPIFDPSKFFVTPEQQQAAQFAANLYGSAPNPAAAAAEARRQAGGVGSTGRPGGYQIVGGGGGGPPLTLPQGGGGGLAVGVNPGTGGLSYGGNVLYGGQTPQGALSNWDRWYSSIQKNPYAPGDIYGTLPTSEPPPGTFTTGTGSYAPSPFPYYGGGLSYDYGGGKYAPGESPLAPTQGGSYGALTPDEADYYLYGDGGGTYSPGQSPLAPTVGAVDQPDYLFG
jgi:hypothetical protein